MGSEVTVGYKYLLSMHLVFSHGPIDRLIALKVDDKLAFVGDVTTNEQLTIDQPGLFGGETREGGVQCTVQVLHGGPTQLPDTYLQSLLALVPGYRGVFSLLFKRSYLGMNPYLKRWAGKMQRITVGDEGTEQWYVDKAVVFAPDAETVIVVAQILAESFTSLGAYTFNNGAATWYSIADNVLTIAAHSQIGAQANIIRTISIASIQKVEVDFSIGSLTPTDDASPFTMWMAGPSLFIIVNPAREAAFDPTRAPYVGVGGANTAYGTTALTSGVIYRCTFEVTSPTQWTVTIKNRDTNVVFGTPMVFTVGQPATPLLQLEFNSDSASGSPETKYYSVKVFAETGSALDMNPSHIIRECLTNADWGMGYPDADMGDSFIDAADALFDEQFGLSLVWDRQIPIEDFVKEVLKHIDAALYLDPATGKFEIKLIRNDYDVGTLLVFDQSNVEDVENFTRRQFDEMVNSVTLQYQSNLTDRDASVEVQDIAQVQLQSGVINTTVNYPGISKPTLASRIAARDLHTLSSPLASATILANQDARELRIGSPFKLVWPSYSDAPFLIMRVTGMSIGDGKTNKVRMTATEDAFSIPAAAYVATGGSEWENPTVVPEPVGAQVAFEIPYFELVQQSGQGATDSELATNEDAGFVGAAAPRPASAINAVLATDTGTGYVDDGSMDFCPSCTITTPIDQDDVSVVVADLISSANITVDTHAQIDEELIKVVSLVGTTLTFKRGMLDTVPAEHAADATIFFWDRFFGFDPTQYSLGETLNLKIKPVTGLGELSLADAIAMPLTLAGRAFRPYAPGDVKVGAVSYPSVVETSIVVTWVHRDRTQQTSTDFIEQDEASIGPEAGTTYNVRVYDDDTNILLDSTTGISGTSTTLSPDGSFNARLEVEAQRDGVVSWQPQVRRFAYSGGGVRDDDEGVLRVTEIDDLRVLED